MFDIDEDRETISNEARAEQAEWEQISSGFGQNHSPFVDDDEDEED